MPAINMALIGKLGWKILSELDNMWIKHQRDKYIRYGNIFTSSNIANPSWLWKGILEVKSLLQSDECLEVSVTSNIPIWTTPWIPTILDFRPSPKFPNNHNQSSSLISNLIHQHTQTWNSNAINAIF